MRDLTAVVLAFIVVGLMLFVPAVINSIITYAFVTVDTTPPEPLGPPSIELAQAWDPSAGEWVNTEWFTLSEDESEPTGVDDTYHYVVEVHIVVQEDNPGDGTLTITAPDGTTTTYTLFKVYDSATGGYKYFRSFDNPDVAYDMSTVGEAYSFTFTINDEAGNTFTGTYYILRLPEFPTGYWVLAGQQVTEDSHIYVNTLTVHVEWYCTLNPQYVSTVYVKIYDQAGNLIDTVTLTKTDDTWEGDITFPSEGTFEVRGYVADTFGRSQRTLTIVGEMPTSPPTLTPGGPRGLSLKAIAVALFSAVVIVGFISWARKRGWLGRA